MGRVDLHCHLLWGIDDGAKTEADALEMARALVSLGYSDVAPSPHAKPEYPAWEVCHGRRAELQAALDREGVPLRLHPGAENVLGPELLERWASDARPIGAGKFVLAEAPYFGALPQLGELVFRLKLKGVTPLVAHPERCREFERPGRAAEAVRAGAALQLDLGALVNRYGPAARKLARTFLDEGLYAVAASDLHSPRDAARWVGESIEALVKHVGREEAERLLEANPRRILLGEPVSEA